MAYPIKSRTDDVVDFSIFVDESHQFKNLTFNTRHDRVAGLGNSENSRSRRICSWLLWTNMYFTPNSWEKVPIYSRFVPGVYRPVLRPCDFCPNPAQACLRYA